jgi:hypothetical protein
MGWGGVPWYWGCVWVYCTSPQLMNERMKNWNTHEKDLPQCHWVHHKLCIGSSGLCDQKAVTNCLSYSTTFEVGVVSSGITFIADIVKISQLVQKLKGEHRDACMHAKTQNTRIHCLSHTCTCRRTWTRTDIVSVLFSLRKERKKKKTHGQQARVWSRKFWKSNIWQCRVCFYPMHESRSSNLECLWHCRLGVTSHMEGYTKFDISSAACCLGSVRKWPRCWA